MGLMTISIFSVDISCYRVSIYSFLDTRPSYFYKLRASTIKGEMTLSLLFFNFNFEPSVLVLQNLTTYWWYLSVADNDRVPPFSILCCPLLRYTIH